MRRHVPMFAVRVARVRVVTEMMIAAAVTVTYAMTIAVARAAAMSVRVGVALAPEAAQRHGSEADGAQQQTRDVEVHQKETV
jgi:hypothetical protein